MHYAEAKTKEKMPWFYTKVVGTDLSKTLFCWQVSRPKATPTSPTHVIVEGEACRGATWPRPRNTPADTVCRKAWCSSCGKLHVLSTDSWPACLKQHSVISLTKTEVKSRLFGKAPKLDQTRNIIAFADCSAYDFVRRWRHLGVRAGLCKDASWGPSTAMFRQPKARV